MKIIFAKYNNERLPCFQTVTRIIQENGILKALKEPLSPLAVGHINKIYSNYQFLLDRYPHIKLCKPKLVGDSIEFEMARGKSFEKLLKSALDSNDKSLFIRLIKQYINYLDGFVAVSGVKFEPCSKFTEIFGPCVIDSQEDIINIANIDLIFSNLFICDDEITEIDYEWVLNVAIPKSFILWRSIFVFFTSYGATYAQLISMNEVLSILNIDMKLHETYTLCDQSFQKIVYGSDFRYLINTKNQQPRIEPFKTIEIMAMELNSKAHELSGKTHELSGKTHELSVKVQELDTKSQQLELVSYELMLTQSSKAYRLGLKVRIIYMCVKKPIIWLRVLFKSSVL